MIFGQLKCWVSFLIIRIKLKLPLIFLHHSFLKSCQWNTPKIQFLQTEIYVHICGLRWRWTHRNIYRVNCFYKIYFYKRNQQIKNSWWASYRYSSSFQNAMWREDDICSLSWQIRFLYFWEENSKQSQRLLKDQSYL